MPHVTSAMAAAATPSDSDFAHEPRHAYSGFLSIWPFERTYQCSLGNGLPATRSASQSATRIGGNGPRFAAATLPTEWRELLIDHHPLRPLHGVDQPHRMLDRRQLVELAGDAEIRHLDLVGVALPGHALPHLVELGLVGDARHVHEALLEGRRRLLEDRVAAGLVAHRDHRGRPRCAARARSPECRRTCRSSCPTARPCPCPPRGAWPASRTRPFRSRPSCPC